MVAVPSISGALLRFVDGMLVERIGPLRTRLIILIAGLKTAWWFGMDSFGQVLAFGVVLGLGNGALFQLVPQEFWREIGVMKRLVGMTGAIGGFSLTALLGIFGVETRWPATWGAMAGVARI